MELTKTTLCKLISHSSSHPIPLFFYAESLGVPKTTYFKWLAKGEDDIKKGISSLHADLFKGVKELEYKNVVSLIKDIGEKDSNKHVTWLLERLWPDVFYNTKGHLELYVEGINRNELQIVKQKLHPSTALANTDSNADKFKVNVVENNEET